MILYGALKNQVRVLTGVPVPISKYGAVRIRTEIAVELGETNFPIYGAVLTTGQAPNRLVLYGAHHRKVTAPSHFSWYSSKMTSASKGANISGLQISGIGIELNFPTPAVSYNIAPYLPSDVYKILGGTDYLVIGSQIMFNTIPSGPITVIPFSRLQINADEVKQLVVNNIIPNRAEYRDIVVSSTSYMFSLDKVTWTSSLTVTDTFYVRAPSMLVDGTDVTQDILVDAKVYPRG